MAVGVIGTQLYETENQVTMIPGESVNVGGYTLLYENLAEEIADDHLDIWAVISTYEGSEYLTTLKPRINFTPFITRP